MDKRDQLRLVAGRLAPALDATLHSQVGERTGFLVFLFDFKTQAEVDIEKGSAVYITNAAADDLVKMIREVLVYVEAGAVEPRGPRGRG